MLMTVAAATVPAFSVLVVVLVLVLSVLVLTAVVLSLLVVGAVGAVGATSSSSRLRVVVLVVVLVVLVLPPLVLLELVELLLEPLAPTLPVMMIAPPVTLIDPVEPPELETVPSTVTAWAVAVISLAEVMLPSDKIKDAEFVTKLPSSLVMMLPLLVIAPVALSVKVVAAPLLGAITASAAKVKSPFTSIVTFETAKAAEIASAVEAPITMSSGSSNQVPMRPRAAVTSTMVVRRISSTNVALVSIKPPLPPALPPWALKVPATVVFRLDQMLISPPLPLWVDEASTTACSATVTVLAKFSALMSVRLPSAFWV